MRKNKKDYDDLLEVINQEARIHLAYSNLKGTNKEIADNRLKYISDFKATFEPYEIQCIDEMLKPVVDKKKIEALIKEQIDTKRKNKEQRDKDNAIAEKEGIERKYKAEYEEAVFIAWFITALIKQKVFFHDDLDAAILYEILKSFLAPERPNTSLNI